MRSSRQNPPPHFAGHRCGGLTRVAVLARLTATLVFLLGGVLSGTAQDQTTDQGSSAVTPSQTVRFSFSGVPWRDVIDWIAEEANLALHIDGVPAGSFTYSDPDSFTHQEAIDRINLFLLPQGYTLVRNSNLLSVINLSDPRSLQQLDALAKLVRVEDLSDLPRHDVVKCLFPLGQLSAADAVEELSAIKLMMQPAELTKTNQLLITDTVAKLLNVKAVLDSFEPSKLDNGTVVKSFALQHVEAEDVLVVARPHLGLATGEMIGIDVSLSADLQGKNIFATGIEDKIKLIERLVESIDTPSKSVTSEDSDARLQTHPVEGGNVDLAYDVLQTLLVGKDVRISKDETAGTIVALASPSIQEEISATVEKLAAEEADFEVVPLRHVDPYVAIGLIEQLLDLPSPYEDDDDRDNDEIAPPKIDADPENRRLFVRGRPSQIEEVKKIVEGLDQTQPNELSEQRIRLLSLKGNHARQSLMLAARFWRHGNPIMFFESEQAGSQAVRERVVHEPNPSSNDQDDLLLTMQSKAPPQFVSTNDRGKLLPTPSPDVSKPAIQCQLTSRGLLIQCEDIDVLNEFQTHLETLAGPGSSVPAEPITFYLKYTRPEDAIRMLAELLDGGEAIGSTADALVNGVISSADSFIGSLVTNREGTLTLISGSATVVADARLNRLIVQGTTDDIQRIENYLRIIEKDSSITAVETYGSSHVIELLNTRASEVEAAVRQAFGNRVAANTTVPGAGGGSNASRADLARANEAENQAKEKKTDNKKQPTKAASPKASDLAPKMTLAVHEASNSLIVTAPDDLFKEVEALCKIIDGRGEQTIRVITPSSSHVLESVLQGVILGQSDNRNRPSARYSSSSRSSSQSRSKD